MPLSSSEIKINTTSCNTLPKLANETRETIERIIKSGALFRFALLDPLATGGDATASIKKFSGGGFVQDKTGTVHDEDGVWSGQAGDEGWCQPRDGQEGHYSIVTMPDAGGRQTMAILLDSGLFSPATTGDDEDLLIGGIGSAGRLSNQTGTGYIPGERWRVEDDGITVTDMIGGWFTMSIYLPISATITDNSTGLIRAAIQKTEGAGYGYSVFTDGSWFMLNGVGDTRIFYWSSTARLLAHSLAGWQYKATLLSTFSKASGVGAPTPPAFAYGNGQMLFEDM